MAQGSVRTPWLVILAAVAAFALAASGCGGGDGKATVVRQRRVRPTTSSQSATTSSTTTLTITSTTTTTAPTTITLPPAITTLPPATTLPVTTTTLAPTLPPTTSPPTTSPPAPTTEVPTTTSPPPTTELPTTTSPPPTTAAPPPPPPAPGPSGNGLGISQIAGGWVVRIDSRILRFNLMPGVNESGGGLIRPPFISDDYRARVVAAFNGGFQFKDSGGGFYLGGVTVQGLQDGAASLVIRNDGSATVGQWGRDVSMGPDVEAVLQNLHLMVDGGAATDVAEGDTSRWGPTLGGTAYVPRSGLCVDGGGSMNWVGGPGLSSAGLAQVMVAAGCARGMELDINPQWVSFAIYDHNDPANPGSISDRNLYDGMYYGPDSYFSSRGRNWVMLTAK